MRILIIEEDKPAAGFLRETLTQEGYAVDTACTGDEGEYLAETFPYDAILLDIQLSGKDGIQVCTSLRLKKVGAPILMLIDKTWDFDVVKALDSGADDYFVKPFEIGILFSKLRALTRRGQNFTEPRIEIGTLRLDAVNKQLWQGTREILLTSKEYAILEYLAIHPNRLITRLALEQHVWNLSADTGSNIIDVHIKNLRAKLGKENRYLIQTSRGRGYQLNLVTPPQ